MSILGRLIILTQDTDGTSSVGCTVNIYKQGAQIFGTQAGPAYTVDSPGGLVVGDTVFAASNPGTTTQVTVVTATVVTLSASLGTLSDDDRLICTTNMPTLYEDNQGSVSMSNPLTTDASGVAACWIMGGYYDADFSGGTPSLTRAFQYDIYLGAESTKSNQFSGTVLKSDSLRTLAATDILLDLSNAGTNKFKVMGDGEIVAGAAGATHNLTGTLTTSSTITATAGGIVATAGGVTATAGGVTATAGGVTATTGNIQATAGDLISRRLIATKGTAVVAGDFALGAGWGNTATVSSVLSGSTDTRGAIRITCNGAGIAANPTVTLTFKDGTFPSGISPFTVACAGTGTSVPAATDFFYAAGTLTQAIWWYGGLPTAGRVYELSYVVIG